MSQAGSADHSARIWDAATGQELLTLREHTGTVWSVAFSPDGRQLLSGSDDNTVRLREAATEAEVLNRTAKQWNRRETTEYTEHTESTEKFPSFR